MSPTPRKAPNVYILAVILTLIIHLVMMAIGAQPGHIIVVVMMASIALATWWYRRYGRSTEA